MKILNKLFLVLLILNSIVFGADTTTPETQFTKGVNERTSCQVECPPKMDFLEELLILSLKVGQLLVMFTQNNLPKQQ